MTLMLHAGAQAIDYDGLRLLTTPAPTETHVPIPHHRVVDLVRYSLGFHGHNVVEEAHGVTEDGMRYFGLLSLKSSYGDYTDTVGLRNSHDRKFPVGIGFGSKVFVCDNLAFIAEQVIRRKHTANAKRDLPGLVGQLIEPLAEQRELQHRTFDRYKATKLPNELADYAILALYRSGVVNLQRLPEIIREWDEPSFPDFAERNAWRLFNAATFAMNGRVAENPGITQRLHKVIDGVCEQVN